MAVKWIYDAKLQFIFKLKVNIRLPVSSRHERMLFGINDDILPISH